MSDKTIDQISIARSGNRGLGDAAQANDAKGAAQARTQSAGPSDEVAAALNKDAVTVVRSESYEDMLNDLGNIAKKFNLIGPPSDKANLNAADQAFQDAYQSVGVSP